MKLGASCQKNACTPYPEDSAVGHFVVVEAIVITIKRSRTSKNLADHQLHIS